jgi:hypothetical protein
MNYFIISLMLLLTSCTCSITIVHTEGTAMDVVDETASASPTTTVSIPVSPLP